MSVSTQWYDDREEIIVFKFGSYWNWKEFYEANHEAEAWAARKAHIVDAIFDFSQDSSVMPDNLVSNFVGLAKRSEKLQNQGMTVVVSDATWIHVFVQIIITVARTHNIAIVRSQARALRLIESTRQKRLLQNQH